MSPSGEIHPRITGWGKALPSRVVTNFDLESKLDTTDEWIRTRTGIRERRIASEGETTSSLAAKASIQALERAHVNPQDLDLIFLTTSTPDALIPASSATLQKALGAGKAGACDVNAACCGFMYGLSIAYQFVSAGTFKNVLVVGSEVYSRILDWKDRSTCVLFGDGAGAVVVQGSGKPLRKASFVLGTEGEHAGLINAPNSAKPGADGTMSPYLTMDGPKVFKLAVTWMIKSTEKAIENAGLKNEQVSLFIPHQANIRIIEAATNMLKMPKENIFVNVDKYGNTASASIPIALCEAVEEKRIKPGEYIAMTAFGAGISWASAVIQWDPEI